MYDVKVEKVGPWDGGPRVVAILISRETGVASTLDIDVTPESTDTSVLMRIKSHVDYLTRRDAAFDALKIGAVSLEGLE